MGLLELLTSHVMSAKDSEAKQDMVCVDYNDPNKFLPTKSTQTVTSNTNTTQPCQRSYLLTRFHDRIAD